MANPMEGAMEFVKAVGFSFYSNEEVKKMAPHKITNPNFLDGMNRPVPDGLYDPKLGPLNEYDRSPCRSCGQSAFHCHGHFGHIELCSLVYNPLLFDMLHHLLQRMCFFCGHFRVGTDLVKKCISQLELIIKGDIVGAKKIENMKSKHLHNAHMSHSVVPPHSKFLKSGHLKKQGWTGLQLTEAMSILHAFLKPRYAKCKVCNSENPKITKPTFGLLCMNDMSGARLRANVLRGCKMEVPLTDVGGEDKHMSNSSDDVFPARGAIDTVDTNLLKEDKRKQIGQVPAEFLKQLKAFSGPLSPVVARTLIKNLWENEPKLCSLISDINQARVSCDGSEERFSMFFIDTIVVPPIKFRPPAAASAFVLEHPQTVLLENVQNCNIALHNEQVKNPGSSAINRLLMYLQQSVNVLFDSKTAMKKARGDVASGICQLLEKKEGIFRQKMMGKRVNHACRSVISPDPYLAVNEIGIPPYFALKLTYPERVTSWNVVKMRDAIINGPEIHPGATHYMDKLFNMRKLQEGKKRISISRKLPSSRGVVIEPGKNCDYDFEGKVVYRHLQDGDIVLVNRQPTLHKPSIMAHVVRVLKGEKTIRMHYSNCSTYNADFDGDEMNVHFPQDEISRAEAYNLVNANNQYIVPTRGDAKRGLIQDHIVSAVLLTKKDTFFTREEFTHLLYSSGVSCSGPRCSFGKVSQKVYVLDNEIKMQLPLPAVWKPKPLWTGKQVITALLNHITRGRAPFSVEKDGKIPREYLGRKIDSNGTTMKNIPCESTMLVYKNELVQGLIDQAQFGNYGLVHTVQELYGSNTAGLLLSVLSRLFTVFLQMHGFTCGVDDLLILQSYNDERKKKLECAGNIGEQVHQEFLKLKDDKIDPLKLQTKIEEVIRRKGEHAIAGLDSLMSSKLNETSDMNKELLREGLLKPFPQNCISLMTTSGAKGSMVNFSQISSFLGQQELEGKRVPRMISGKTLPCFPPWDCTSRAGGFISDCFLSGLRPQEYYFHCMAGREGLVDTAVKTSRSGYLQRCLIKNLESLKVCYDYTVRDFDGSVVQFVYGEDGVDVHQINFLHEYEPLIANEEIFHEKFGLKLGETLKSEIDRDIEKLPFVRSLSEDSRKHFKMTSGEFVRSLPGKNQDVLFNLMKHKYLSSLAHPGEPVGVIAAQSIGEPSTQMTLNTFHLAGRGEMNVTLGIPRLQEILTTASRHISTPIMSCPLKNGKTEKDGKSLATKLKKVTVADIIEKMEVCVIPVSVHDGQIFSIYKLKMKLYDFESCLKFFNTSSENAKYTLEVVFMRALEDAIQSHMASHFRISGIKDFVSEANTVSSAGYEDDVSDMQGIEVKNDDVENGDDDGDEEDADDIGFDGDKIKRQGKDDVDYEEGSEEDEPRLSESSRKELNEGDDESEISEVGGENLGDIEGVESEVVEEFEELSKAKPGAKSGEKKAKKEKPAKKNGNRKKLQRKQTDRAFFVALEDLNFEAHFRFTKDPHILLAQIAQRAAKKVHIKNTGKMERCEVIKCSPDNVLGFDPTLEEDEWALQSAGVNFPLFWEMHEDLSLNRIYTNNVQSMLDSYGVEAARSTIIKEIHNVFKLYGVTVNTRHLTLIADYMTHCGGYRAMSRSGAMAASTSPLTKMTYESASKFVVEAAYHALSDNLESPSARVCLGLPVKLGTGCFDVMHRVDV